MFKDRINVAQTQNHNEINKLIDKKLTGSPYIFKDRWRSKGKKWQITALSYTDKVGTATRPTAVLENCLQAPPTVKFQSCKLFETTYQDKVVPFVVFNVLRHRFY